MRARVRAWLVLAVTLPSAGAEAQMEARTRHRIEVDAPDAAALVAAIQRAATLETAQKVAFTVASYSADSGLVRVYEQHVKLDTLQKSRSWGYYSGGCWSGIGACSYVVRTQPLITDERGLLTTWRLISFEAVRAGRYRVLFEHFEPSTGGYADADERERGSFYNELRRRLKQMRRGGGEEEIDGDAFELVAINNQPLPYPTRVGMVAAGTFVLTAAGEFQLVIASSEGRDEQQGRYTQADGIITLSGRGGSGVARLSGDTLSYTRAGARYLFVRR